MSETNLHAVVGLGPVGLAVIDELVTRNLPVRAIARRRPRGLPAAVEFVTADVTDHVAAQRALADAGVVYHAASAPYHRWRELLPPIMSGIVAGAAATGARIVYADNLYAYGPVRGPLTENLPNQASGPNGRLRAALADELLAAHGSGKVVATIGRASDYYGPHGIQSTAGERLFVPALRGKPAQVLGDPDQPHTFTFVPDFARGLVTLGVREEASGEVWHVPSDETVTTREFVRLVFEAAGNPMRLQVLPPLLLRLLAVASPAMRAVREQQYQRESAWIVDHSKFAEAFGVEVTPHSKGVRETLAWFRERDAPEADGPDESADT